jgi:hypothetical protein
MGRLSSVPFTELFELNLALHQLFILGGPVVYTLAGRALQLYKSIL